MILLNNDNADSESPNKHSNTRRNFLKHCQLYKRTQLRARLIYVVYTYRNRYGHWVDTELFVINSNLMYGI